MSETEINSHNNQEKQTPCEQENKEAGSLVNNEN